MAALLELCGTIHYGMPYVLGVMSLAALAFYPVEAARAILFFALGFFSTTVIFGLGFFPQYADTYHPLIVASAVTILLYHSLDITAGLLAAWLIEALLILFNGLYLFLIYAGYSPSTVLHGVTTVLLNFAELVILLGNWWRGTDLVYRKLFDLDVPIWPIRHSHTYAYPEDQEAEDR